jgi:hypothetical protein
MRSVLAISVGFVVIGLLSFAADALLRAVFPGYYSVEGVVTSVPLLLLTQAVVGVCAVFGCYLTGRMAPDRPMRHALILGVLGLVFNVAGSVALWETAPAWYHVLAWLLVMPYAWLGGRLAERRVAPIPAVA